MKNVHVAVIGIGVVGKSVVDVLLNNREIILSRSGINLVPKVGVVRDASKKYDIGIPVSEDIDGVLQDPSIDVIVELVGGVDLPYQIARKAIANKKAFVTANKAMLALHMRDLREIDSNARIGFEASVCGGIPIIRIMRDGLIANDIHCFYGIMNGTSNYILSHMKNAGVSFEESLSMAKKLGYAESEPKLDINGMDTAHKLSILASLVYGVDVDFEDMVIDGISGISIDDVRFASKFGYEIKLLGIAKKRHEELELRVHPVMLPLDSLMSKVDGAMNAVSVVGDRVGESLYCGAGAGGDPTASSVVSDIVELFRADSSGFFGYARASRQRLVMRSLDSIEGKYYVRLGFKGDGGVLPKIVSIFMQHGVFIETLLQNFGDPGNSSSFADKKVTSLSLLTFVCRESGVKRALSEIKALPETLSESCFIRIEELRC